MQLRELSYEERVHWVRLARTSRVGPVAFAGLLARFGDAETALDALPTLAKASKFSIPDRALVEEEIERTEDFGAKFLCACEQDYPAALRAIDPPPPIISVAGDTALLSRDNVAIIGSRNASAVGLRFAAEMATGLGQAGLCVVSGLARGIDTQAHGGALSTGTVAVLGGGVDHVYPSSNAGLYVDIREQGAIVSESPFGHRATAKDFPRRNRIISGLSRGVVVIEAAERSGTLITARYALEQGREVMAAPGSPLDPRTKGCNRLIRQGAALIESAEDVLDILSNTPQLSMREPGGAYDDAPFDFDAASKDIEKAKPILLDLLSPTPAPRDEIIRYSNLPHMIASAALLELELSGEINVEIDGRLSFVA